jgi:K+-sensing histidine kinase KdpD
MVHGNIYPKERVTQALNHFFRTDNLIALRELALRFLADESDEELLENLRRHDSKVVWETCERIMVAVTPDPDSAGADTARGQDRVQAQGRPRRGARRPGGRRHPQPRRNRRAARACG